MKREFIVAVTVLFVLAAGCGGPGDAPEEEGDEEAGDEPGQPPDDPVDEDGPSNADDELGTLDVVETTIRKPVSAPN